MLTLHRPKSRPAPSSLLECTEASCEARLLTLYAHDPSGHPIYRCSDGHLTRVISTEELSSERLLWVDITEAEADKMLRGDVVPSVRDKLRAVLQSDCPS